MNGNIMCIRYIHRKLLTVLSEHITCWTVKEFVKSANIWQSYYDWVFFDPRVYMCAVDRSSGCGEFRPQSNDSTATYRASRTLCYHYLFYHWT